MSWRPRPPFFYGWLVLGVLGVGAFFSTSIAGVVLGGIQGFIVAETGWNRSAIGFAAAAGVWGSGLVAPFIGRAVDRYGPRWITAVGTAILGICLISLVGVHSVWQFYLATILARAISQPLLIGVVPRTLAVNFFRRKRNTALALTGMFRPVSGAIILQIVTLIAASSSWRTAFRYFGILSLLLTLPIVLIVRRRPEDIGLLPDGAKPPGLAASELYRIPEGSTPGNSGQSTPVGDANPEPVWTAREALRTRAFWLVALTVFLSVTAGSALSFNLVPYLHEEAHIPIYQAVGVLSLSTFLALVNLVWGYLADKFTPRVCMIAVMGSAIVITLYLFTVDSVITAYIFGVLWGLISNSMEVLVFMLLAHYFGRSSYGAIAGSMRPFEAGGLGLGQILGAMIYDLTGSYSGLLAGLMGLYFLAALLVFFARRPAAQVDRRHVWEKPTGGQQ